MHQLSGDSDDDDDGNEEALAAAATTAWAAAGAAGAAKGSGAARNAPDEAEARWSALEGEEYSRWGEEQSGSEAGGMCGPRK